MNKLIIAIIGLLPLASFAQIKEVIVDNNNKNTLVIKEGRSSDSEILAQNFDIDNYRVGDVIRITTAPEKAEKQKVESVAKPARSTNARIVKRKKKKKFKLFNFSRKRSNKAKKANFLKCYRF